MKNYLFFDATCSTCRVLASRIETEAKGKLEVVALRSAYANELLGKLFPNGWENKPYLVTVKQDRQTAEERVTYFSGLQMAFKLVSLIGIQGGWRVYWLARSYGVSANGKKATHTFQRRGALKTIAGIIVGLFVVKNVASPGEHAFADPTPCDCSCLGNVQEFVDCGTYCPSGCNCPCSAPVMGVYDEVCCNNTDVVCDRSAAIIGWSPCC